MHMSVPIHCISVSGITNITPTQAGGKCTVVLPSKIVNPVRDDVDLSVAIGDLQDGCAITNFVV
jgi:hypothetical protein